jgi:tRNA splicing ligase
MEKEAIDKLFEKVFHKTEPLIDKRIQHKIKGDKLVYRIKSLVRDADMLVFTVDLDEDSDIPTSNPKVFKKALITLYRHYGLKIDGFIGEVKVIQLEA